ncbi:MAG: hypothetical protein K8W52_45405 [Deltaproteobacteria bacterium]|nr:hypothetical protein [Deltaproteobacteria bacterium]
MRTAIAAALMLAAAAVPAVAQPEAAPAMAESLTVSGGSSGGSARSMSNDWLIPARGYQLGTSLSYAMSDGGFGDRGLKFSDVAFLRLDGRVVVGGKAEIFGGIDLLPKQPTFTDDSVFEGAHVGARVKLKKWLAADVRVDEGSLMSGLGLYGSAQAGLFARRVMHESLVFQGSIGGSWSPMRFDAGNNAWFAEVATAGDVVLRLPEGWAAFWVGFGFAFPVAHHGDVPGVGAIDPQVRSDFRLGSVYSVVKSWDVYVEYTIIDRGDDAAPRTVLPILDGGFDQKQLTFGIARHFARTAKVDHSDDAYQLSRARREGRDAALAAR